MQKTAYEMRISDWSSDVCSSDLLGRQLAGQLVEEDLAGLYLGYIDVFVGLVGLVDGARPAQHDRKAALLEQPAFGGIRHGLGGVVAGQGEHEFLRRAALVPQRRSVGEDFGRDGCVDRKSVV